MKDINKEHIKTGIIISAFTVGLLFLFIHLNFLFGVIGKILYALRYLFYGIIFAYILNQPISRLENLIEKKAKESSFIYKRKRGLSVLLTLILGIILIILLLSIIIPNLIESLISLITHIPSSLNSVVQNIDTILDYMHVDYSLQNNDSVKQFINMPWQDMLSSLLAFLSQNAGDILKNAGNFFSTLGLYFTGFIFSLYLLINKETYIRQFKKLIVVLFGYNLSTKLINQGHKVNVTFSNFISGQFIEACILWVLYYVTMRIFQFPYPELIASIIAVFSFIPFFGPLMAMFIGMILILSKDIFQAIWFMIYFQLLSQIEDNLIYPRVVGQSVGLPGLWVLLSILAFGDLFGLSGILVAVPTSACLYTFVRETVNDILDKKHIKVTKDQIIKKETEKAT